MHNHAPENYNCPFCAVTAGSGDKYSGPEDVVYKDDFTTAFIAPKWWLNNPGYVLVVPNAHYENIYDIPEGQLTAVYKTVKKVATAIRETYDCEGTSTRQHNEPHGNQDIWHFHVHVFPRFKEDNLYQNHGNARFIDPVERAPYIQKLRAYFENQPA